MPIRGRVELERRAQLDKCQNPACGKQIIWYSTAPRLSADVKLSRFKLCHVCAARNFRRFSQTEPATIQ